MLLKNLIPRVPSPIYWMISFGKPFKERNPETGRAMLRSIRSAAAVSAILAESQSLVAMNHFCPNTIFWQESRCSHVYKIINQWYKSKLIHRHGFLAPKQNDRTASKSFPLSSSSIRLYFSVYIYLMYKIFSRKLLFFIILGTSCYCFRWQRISFRAIRKTRRMNRIKNNVTKIKFGSWQTLRGIIKL